MSPVLLRAGPDEELARADEPVGAFEAAQLVLDLRPGRCPAGLVETAEHLVQCAEGLALELGTLRGRIHPQRRLDPLDLDACESRLCEQMVEIHCGERPGQAGPRRRQL